MVGLAWLQRLPGQSPQACQCLSVSLWQLDTPEGAVGRGAEDNEATLRSPVLWAAEEYQEGKSKSVAHGPSICSREGHECWYKKTRLSKAESRKGFRYWNAGDSLCCLKREVDNKSNSKNDSQHSPCPLTCQALLSDLGMLIHHILTMSLDSRHCRYPLSIGRGKWEKGIALKWKHHQLQEIKSQVKPRSVPWPTLWYKYF